jgi:hypothetical protein
MKELVRRIEEAIQEVISGYHSQYIECTSESGENWVIRVSNHGANPLRIAENTISLVIEVPEHETEEDAGGWGISKKSFSALRNQYYLDSCGSFNEHFQSIEEMLNYHF